MNGICRVVPTSIQCLKTQQRLMAISQNGSFIQASLHMYKMFQQATAFNQEIGNWSFIQGGFWAYPCGMESMFKDATSFNQDLSSWSVPLCDSEPLDFSTGCPIEDSNQPQWGTCPTEGCTDSGACNYDLEAGCDDGSCDLSSSHDLGEDIETCDESVTLDAGAGTTATYGAPVKPRRALR